MDRYGQRRGQLAAQKNRPFQSPVKLFHFQNYHVSHYQSIRIGLGNDVSSLRKLSLLSYNQLAHYDSPSYYKLCAISRAAGILAARRKSIRRGFTTRTPYAFTTSPLLLRVQDRERIFAYSCLEREPFQHTLDQTYVRHRISTRGQGSLFHPHLEQTESLHRPRHSHDRMRFHGGCGL